MDELLSPIVTPFVLYFSLLNKAGDIIDFLRNFTIDVSGVGDVCSFAEMNVRKHGNPEWLSSRMSRAGLYEQAEMGKTEISLMNFSVSSPGIYSSAYMYMYNKRMFLHALFTMWTHGNIQQLYVNVHCVLSHHYQQYSIMLPA